MRLKIIDADAEFSVAAQPPPAVQRVRDFCARMVDGELISGTGLMLQTGVCRSTITLAAHFLRDYHLFYRGKRLFGNKKTIAEAKKICVSEKKELVCKKSKSKRS